MTFSDENHCENFASFRTFIRCSCIFSWHDPNFSLVFFVLSLRTLRDYSLSTWTPATWIANKLLHKNEKLSLKAFLAEFTMWIADLSASTDSECANEMPQISGLNCKGRKIIKHSLAGTLMIHDIYRSKPALMFLNDVSKHVWVSVFTRCY